jgi:hypothetical protein
LALVLHHSRYFHSGVNNPRMVWMAIDGCRGSRAKACGDLHETQYLLMFTYEYL